MSDFFGEQALHLMWPKYWTFSFSISSSNKYSGLISFRIDWFDLFAVQGTLKHLLQHHSSKASILWCSTFFMVRLSHPYMATGKTLALTIQTLVSKVVSVFLTCFLGLSQLTFQGKLILLPHNIHEVGSCLEKSRPIPRVILQFRSIMQWLRALTLKSN